MLLILTESKTNQIHEFYTVAPLLSLLNAANIVSASDNCHYVTKTTTSLQS